MANNFLERVKELSEAQGFEITGGVNPADLQVNPQVRDMCAVDRCKMYDHNWMCPPACGELEYFAGRIIQCSEGLLVQTVAKLEDDFDFESMQDAADLHKERFTKLTDQVREEAAAAGASPFFLGAGTCTLCPTCSYPDSPCRHPQRAVVSMEAAGLWVSQVCSAAGIPYNHGKNTIAYTSCILL